MTRRRAERIALNTTGVLVFLVMIFPVYWMVSTAFKPGIDVQTFTPKWFPHPATLSNFTDAIHRPYFWQDVKNSVFVVCVVVAYLTFVLPFCIWTLRGFVMGIPQELEEAALVDGCSRFGAFVRILLPLVAPGLVATSIFAFIQAWNEYIIAYVFLSSPEKQTLTVWLANFTTNRGTAWGSLMAGATLTALPVVAFFVIVHRKIAFGLTAGGVKG